MTAADRIDSAVASVYAFAVVARRAYQRMLARRRAIQLQRKRYPERYSMTAKGPC